MKHISHGDRYDIPFNVNGDLTGATTRFLARRRGATDTLELPHTVTDAEAGEGLLTDTSGLAIGPHRVELEATNGTQVVTYRLWEMLNVDADLDDD